MALRPTDFTARDQVSFDLTFTVWMPVPAAAGLSTPKSSEPGETVIVIVGFTANTTTPLAVAETVIEVVVAPESWSVADAKPAPFTAVIQYQ